MIWESYVFRRGLQVEELWDQMFADCRLASGAPKLLYITGRGFDVRANEVAKKFVTRFLAGGLSLSNATLLFVGHSGYQLSDDLVNLTKSNVTEIASIFGSNVKVKNIEFDEDTSNDADTNATIALRRGTSAVLQELSDMTHVVLDVSSLPRITYMSILLAILGRVVKIDGGKADLSGSGVVFQVLVGEDAKLDSKISAEDPSNDLVYVPGYSEALQSEALRDTPLVWFPILGENRLTQFKKVEETIPSWAEICPILPHPSVDPRRGDVLLSEYEQVLFSARETPINNILYAHESHPFEAYRQLLGAMLRYRRTLEVLGECRIVVTPLASKLITVGSALACFEMKSSVHGAKANIAVPYSEPKRYVANVASLHSSRPDISCLLLTGQAYSQ